MMTTVYAKRVYKLLSLGLAFAVMCNLSACQNAAPLRLYDMQLAPQAAPVKSLGFQLQLADIQVAEPFETQQMWYRLHYQHAQELRAYAENRWSMPPAQLLAQRLKNRWLQAGIQVAGMQHGVAGLPKLKLELDDFSQQFQSPQQSEVHISVRASLIHQHQLLAQQAFSLRQPSQQTDAAGGAQAMALALDQLLDQLQVWTQQHYPQAAH